MAWRLESRTHVAWTCRTVQQAPWSRHCVWLSSDPVQRVWCIVRGRKLAISIGVWSREKLGRLFPNELSSLTWAWRSEFGRWYSSSEWTTVTFAPQVLPLSEGKSLPEWSCKEVIPSWRLCEQGNGQLDLLLCIGFRACIILFRDTPRWEGRLGYASSCWQYLGIYLHNLRLRNPSRAQSSMHLACRLLQSIVL